MKRLFLALTGWFLCLALQAQTPQYAFQYWFDGHYDTRETSMSTTGTWQTQMEISHLSEGFHTLYLHFRDTSGRWSSPRSFLFYRTPSSVADSGLNYAYWFDQNYGSHVSDTTSGSLMVDVSHLSDGFHTLYLQTGKGLVARLQSFLFYKLPASAADTTAYYAYWFDQDYSRRIDGTTGGTVIVDVTDLRDGFHTFNIQTGEGRVAGLRSFLFYKMPVYTPDSLSLHYHAWFDSDLENSQDGHLMGEHLLLGVASLGDGFHTLNLQIGAGDAIMLKSALFYKMPMQDSSDLALTYVCWFDQDYEGRTSGDITGGTLLMDVDSLEDGFHTVNLQFGGGLGAALESFLFYKMPVADISHARDYTYWFDQDYEGRQSGSLTGSTILADVNSLRDGLHNFNLQIGDGSNATLQSWLFYKVPNHGAINENTVLTWHYSIDGREQTPIEVSPTNGLIHLELDVANIAPGLHSMSHYMTSTNGSIDAANTSLFYRSGTGIVRYEYWYNDADTDRVVVEVAPADTLQLITMLQVPPLPLRSTSFEFDPNDGTPVIYAKNQVAFRFWTGDSRFIERTSDYVDLYTRDTVVADTLERNTSRTIASPSGNSIHWFKLEAGPGDSLVFNTDRGCQFQLFAPSGDEVLNAEGTEAVAGKGCHVWEDGIYYLAVHEAGTETDSLMITYQWIYKYAALAWDVHEVGNESMTAVTILGNGFDSLQSVYLVRTGSDTIYEVYIDHRTNNNILVFFETETRDTGMYDMAFQFVDYSTSVPDGMHIVPYEEGELISSVQYEPSTTAQTATFSTTVINTGNTTAYKVPIYVHLAPPPGGELSKPHVSFEHHLQGGYVYTDTLKALGQYYLDSLGQERYDSLCNWIKTTYGDDNHFIKTKVLADNGRDSIVARSNYFLCDIAPRDTMHLLVKVDHRVGPHRIITYSTRVVRHHKRRLTPSYRYKDRPVDLYNPTYGSGGSGSGGSGSGGSGSGGSGSGDSGSGDSGSGDSGSGGSGSGGSGSDDSGSDDSGSGGSGSDDSGSDDSGSGGSGSGGSGSGGSGSGGSGSVWCCVHEQVECILSIVEPSGVVSTVSSILSKLACGEDFDPSDYGSYAATLTGNKIAGTIFTTYNCFKAFTKRKPNCPPGRDGSGGTEYLAPGDPNDIHGYLAESGSHYVAREQQRLNYTIEFENDPEIASANATRITIKDTLDASKFDYSTFAATGVMVGDRKLSVDNKKKFVGTLDMRPDVNCVAQVTVDFDTATGIATWQFASLDPMTLQEVTDYRQGLLPVNAGTNGIGTVSFTINRKATTHDGDSIFNRASIVFDNEEAILTPTWVNIVDDIDPMSQIVNAVTIEDSTTFYFQGSDNRSGIWRYTLYGRADTTQAWDVIASGIEDSTYRMLTDDSIVYYMVTATDSAGNREIKTTEGDFSTTQGVATYYTVTATANGWQGVASGGGRVREYRTTTLTAIPSYGYHFTAWNDGDTNNPRTITVRSDTTLTALFDVNRYQIEASSADGNSGSVAGSGEYAYLTIDTITAAPAPHHHFLRWSDGNTDNPRIITVTRDSTLTALFAIDTHSVTLHGDEELVAVTGGGNYPYGAAVTVNATMLSPCHSFEAWSSGGTARDTAASFTFTVDADIDLTALCQLNHYSGSEQRTACNSYTWHGTEYTAGGTPTYQTVNANGCDSTATLMLTINHPTFDTTVAEACNSYQWNGYNYTTSGLYTKTIHPSETGLCDSTTVLNLTIKNSTAGSETIAACEEYTWYQSTYRTTGDYSHVLTGDNGCDSIATLHLTVLSPSEASETVTACNSYTWNGQARSNSGDYTHLSTNIHGCDSITTLHLTINHSTSGDEAVTANDSYLWHGTTYVESGNYQWHGINADGCDSTATLHLTLHYSTEGSERIAACGSHTWHGTTYSQSGIYTFDTTNVAGADSTITLYLTINQPTSGSVSATACDSYSWHGEVLTLGGIYHHHTTNAKGCDSTATLQLTIRHSSAGTETIAACESYSWHGATYTSSGTHTFLTTNAAGCDSTATLLLTINRNSRGEESITACDSYTWHGQSYTFDGNYSHVVANTAGCDSLITLHLTLKHSTSGSEYASACESYTWHGTDYTAGGVSTWHGINAAGCDSTATLYLTINHATSGVVNVTACDSYTWHGTEYGTDGTPTYQTVNTAGCDSTVTLNLTINHSTTGTEAVTACDSYTWHGTEYTAGGTATYQTFNAAGCDSTVTLNLTLYHSNSGIEAITACDNYTWHGTTYFNSTNSPTFKSTNMSGCDSVTTLHLTINHSNAAVESITVCDSYTWHGTTYTESTNMPTFTAPNAEGCDSVTMLHLTVNRSSSATINVTACDHFSWYGNVYTASTNTPTFTRSNSMGCDSTVTLNLTINYSTSGTDTVAACNSYNWHGTEYTASGTLTYQTVNAAGCDSTATLMLTVNHSNAAVENITACNSYVWHGTEYTASTNMPTFTSKNAAGCDSVTTLNLVIQHCSTTEITACDSYTWHGTSYSASGTYTDGSDTLVLTINHSTTAVETVTACDSYTWHGTEYIAGGTPTYQTVNAAGCDSTVTLNLTVNYSTTAVETVTVCDSYTWHGAEYIAGGTPTYQTVNAAGCDSTVTLNLTINYSTTAVEAVTACDSYTWHGTEYSAGGTPTYQTVNAAGCDSTVTLNLTINYSTTSVEAVTACDSYTWHGTEYSAGGTPTYQTVNAAGCDSTVTLNLTINHSTSAIVEATACNRFVWHGNVYTAPTSDAVYTSTNAVGCDSTTTLHLTMNYTTTGIETVTACNSYLWHGTEYSSSTNTPTFTSTGASGCDSITTLHLTINRSTSAVENITSCDSFTWHGNTFNTSTGTSTFTSTNAAGCDSVTTLHLTINYSTSSVENVTACDSYSWHDTEYTASTNTPTFTSLNAAGCEHVTTLNLTVNNSSSAVETVTACNSYTWHGTTYYTVADEAPSYHTLNSAGCDSTVTLMLTINHSTAAVEEITTCNRFVWHGTEYTESTNTPTFRSTNTAGCDSITTLHLTILSCNTTIISGCDSYTWHGSTYSTSGTYVNGTDTLVLTINHSTTAVETVTACDSYMWHGTEYIAGGTPTYQTVNAAGCDSTVTLNLTINYSTTSVETVTACNSYTWHGTEYSAGGTPTYQTVNAAGCDSTVTLNLTINYSTSSTETVTECDSYTWHGTEYIAGGTPTYQTVNATGCDSTVTLNLTINYSNAAVENITACNSYVWHGTEYTASTNTPTFTSTNAAGCDSVTTLNLVIQHCSTTEITACDSYTWHGTSYSASGTYTDGSDTLVLTINHSTTAVETVTACDSYTWHGIEYIAGGTPTYQTVNVAGCDSTVTLNLTINYSNAAVENITACNSYVWHGTEYTASTNTPTFTSTNAAGCDSVTTLNLVIQHCSTTEITACDSYTWHGTSYSASGTYTDGSDTLVLTINHSTTAVETVTACDSYTWHGTEYSAGGTPTYQTVNAAGCDSTVTLNLTINYSTSSTETVTACDSYTWHGTEYTASTNTPTFTSTNAAGCDSVTTLNLIIQHCSTTEITACDSYTWHGTSYSASGTYTDGSDTLVLTINHSTTAVETVTACDSYTWHGTEYSAGGTPTYQTVNAAGCDSTVTLNLTINYSTTAVETVTACDSYTWHGTEYSAGGTPTYQTVNAAGCDSTVMLNLTINYSTSSTETVTACDSYTWHGTEYIAGGTPTYQTVNAAGCDSTVTLNLTINYSTSSTETVTACDSYTWHGTEYIAGGTPTYQTVNAAGCDSTVTLNLTVNYSATTFDTLTVDDDQLPFEYSGTTISTGGDYTIVLTTVDGCDSTIMLHVDVVVGIDAISVLEDIQVYPNPTGGKITIQAEGLLSVEVLDIRGMKVDSCNGCSTIDLSGLPAGQYLLHIHTTGGNTIRKVVKQ